MTGDVGRNESKFDRPNTNQEVLSARLNGKRQSEVADAVFVEQLALDK